MRHPPLTPAAWLRHDLIFRLLDEAEGSTLLEVGAGGGSMGARLAERFEYTGVEPDDQSFEVARRRLARVGRGTVLHGDSGLLDHDQTFDIVCAFEVLEHIDDDRKALSRWRGHARPGGALILSVPAYQERFGPMDERVGHLRRYERDELTTLLVDAGLHSVTVWSYGILLGRLLERVRNAIAHRQGAEESLDERTAASGRTFQPSETLGWLTRFGTAPFRLAQRPFVHRDLGIGFVVRGRVPR